MLDRGLAESGKCVQEHTLWGKHADSPRFGKESWFGVVCLSRFLEVSRDGGKWPRAVPRKVHFRHQKPTLANNPELKLGTETTVVTCLHETR